MTTRVFHRDLKRDYPIAYHGERCWIVDNTGKRWLDACSSAGAVTLGYGITEIENAIIEQASKLCFVYTGQFTNQPQEELAKLVTDLAQPGLSHAFFVTGGSEATESALKLARLYHIEQGQPTKYKVIARWNSYHGNTLGALSMSGRTAWRRAFAPLLIDVCHISAPYYYRFGRDFTPEQYGLACADELELAILREGPENVAAFIAEPIIGGSATGVTPPDTYWPRIREICDRYDVLLIVDEVLTGFGRTGADFAIQHWDIVPDMITCGKGISGGYAPLGAVIVHERIWQAFFHGSGRLAHSFTFTGHALSCAAGVGAVNYLRENNLSVRARVLGEYLFERAERLKEYSIVGDIRGKGLLMGIELVADRDTKRPFDPEREVATRLVAYARECNVLLHSGSPGMADGHAGDQIQVMPPLTTHEEEIDLIIDAIEYALKQLEEKGL